MTKEQFLAYEPKNEDQFQSATFRYINNNYPTWRKLVFHVANESATSDQMRMTLKSKGVVPGIPDIVCVKPLFGLELKMKKGVHSEHQKTIEKVWTENGIPYFLCRNAVDVLDALTTMDKNG